MKENLLALKNNFIFLKQYRDKCQHWWSQLVVREKQAVIIGSTLLSLVVLYAAIWSPFTSRVATLRTQIIADQKNLAWMQAADKQIKILSKDASSANSQMQSPVVLLGLIQKQIAQSELNQNMSQLKQASSETIQLQFQKVSFDKLMSLLTLLTKEQQITVKQLSIIKLNTPGVVNADIIIK